MTFHHLFEGNVRMDLEVDLSDPAGVTLIASGLAVQFVREFWKDEWERWLQEGIVRQILPHLTAAQRRCLLEEKIAFREK